MSAFPGKEISNLASSVSRCTFSPMYSTPAKQVTQQERGGKEAQDEEPLQKQLAGVDLGVHPNKGQKARLKGQCGNIAMVDWEKARQIRFKGVVGVDISTFAQQSGPVQLLTLPSTKYTCGTQHPKPPFVAKSKPTELFVGFNGTIPLWKPGSTVNLAVYALGWPSENHAYFVANQLAAAASVWNNTGANVKFGFTTNIDDAAYLAVYGGENPGVYAETVFPNSNELSGIWVYSLSFSTSAINYLVNILTHELGHTLGLRHEFAQQEGFGEVQWGPKNPNSVMAYVFPPTVQTSDIESIVALYNYAGSSIAGVRIERFEPNN